MVSITSLKSKGLSLIELIVVIAVIGIALAFGIPMYTTNVYKVNVSQMVNKLGTYKLQMIDAYTATAEWPATINGVTAPGSAADSTFENAVNFRYNTADNIAWWGYQLSNSYGSGWIFMLVIANPDGSFNTHCGSLSDSCVFGYCSSLAYFPAGCNETELSTTFSLTDS